MNDVVASGRRRAPDMIVTAPRGVGKTSVVLEFQDLSQDQGFEVVRLQAASGNAGLVESLVRRARARADDGSGPWERAKRAFDRVSSVTLPVVGGGIGLHEPARAPVPRTVSPEDLADALATLAREVRKDRESGGVLITVDEIQAAAAADLTLLAAALQGLNAEYPDARVMFAASGLPQTFQVLIDAGVTHPDRLFRFRRVPLVLAPDDARYAIVEPARQRSVAWEPEAADLVIEVCRGYPAHLQVFADETWLAATGPDRITLGDAREGVVRGARTLEQESLGPRFDGMSDREREFLAALSVNGGETTSAVVAHTLDRSQQSLSQVRETLIIKGDVYAPRRGALALTVPVFARFIVSHYEEARRRSSRASSLVTLETMERFRRSGVASEGKPPELGPGHGAPPSTDA